jgi:hypothetical protein
MPRIGMRSGGPSSTPPKTSPVYVDWGLAKLDRYALVSDR